MSQPGSGDQRTRLARLRTGLGLAALGLLLGRQGLSEGSWPQLVAGFLAMGSAIAVAGGSRPGVTPAYHRIGGPTFLAVNVLVICVLALAGALKP